MRQTTLHKLNAKAVKSAPDGWHSDGGGLYLRVKGESRSWVFRWAEGAKKRERAIGPQSAISLATARLRATEARDTLAAGKVPELVKAHPERAEVAAEVKTLGAAAQEYIHARRATWSNAKHAAQWQASLDLHATDLLKMPVTEITSADVADTLTPIWLTKIETASRVRQRIERILGACIARGERAGPNPAALRDNLEVILPSQGRVKVIKHHAAISVKDAPAAFAAIWGKRDAGIGYAGLITLALTALRSGEVRRLEWTDIEGDTIIIPADRMKARKDHRVPVSPQLMSYLQAQPRWADTALVHAGQAGRPMSDMTLAKALKGAGYGDYTPHGWRSTFSDWANDSGWSRDLVEDQLAHTIGSAVERAYRRADFLDRRRPMMDAWAGYLVSVL